MEALMASSDEVTLDAIRPYYSSQMANPNAIAFFRRKVTELNKVLIKVSKYWPDWKPLSLFYGFQKASYDLNNLLEHIKFDRFLRDVISGASNLEEVYQWRQQFLFNDNTPNFIAYCALRKPIPESEKEKEKTKSVPIEKEDEIFPHQRKGNTLFSRFERGEEYDDDDEEEEDSSTEEESEDLTIQGLYDIESKSKSKPQHVWTPEEDDYFISEYLKGTSLSTIGDTLEFSDAIVRERLAVLVKQGVLKTRAHVWKSNQEAQLIREFNEGVSPSGIAIHLGRSVSSVHSRISKLRKLGILEKVEKKFGEFEEKKRRKKKRR